VVKCAACNVMIVQTSEASDGTPVTGLTAHEPGDPVS
jgi:hypothetical protein